jgi:hypothetical protein
MEKLFQGKACKCFAGLNLFRKIKSGL